MTLIEIDNIIEKAKATREHSPTFCLEYDVPLLIEAIRVLQRQKKELQNKLDELWYDTAN